MNQENIIAIKNAELNIKNLKEMKKQIEDELNNLEKEILFVKAPIEKYKNHINKSLGELEEAIQENYAVLKNHGTDKNVPFFKKANNGVEKFKILFGFVDLSKNEDDEKKALSHFEIIKQDMKSIADFSEPPENSAIESAKDFFSKDGSPYAAMFKRIREIRQEGMGIVGKIQVPLANLNNKRKKLENDKILINENLQIEQGKLNYFHDLINSSQKQDENSYSGKTR